jgi:hypothetical protein
MHTVCTRQKIFVFVSRNKHVFNWLTVPGQVETMIKYNLNKFACKNIICYST